ncbi:endonuclease domain-containing protein [Geodermatophilus sp. SYSU D00742]
MSEMCKWREAPCQREIYYLSRGLCARHYALARRHGILDEQYPKPVLSAVCKAENCTRPRVTKGYCHGHYVHYEYRGRTGPMGPPKHFLSDADLDDETATCAVCGPETPVFVSRRRGSGERYARMCLSLYPGVRERARARDGAVRYALTPEDRERLLERQGGICANPSCGRPDTGPSRWARLATDHDHSSAEGAVRGLICRTCNAAIGMAPGDNLVGVLGLAVYLAEYKRPDLTATLRRVLGSVVSVGGAAGEVGLPT